VKRLVGVVETVLLEIEAVRQMERFTEAARAGLFDDPGSVVA
jgi:hypothetical protein